MNIILRFIDNLPNLNNYIPSKNLGVTKVLGIFTATIPLGLGLIYGSAYLADFYSRRRVTKKETDLPKIEVKADPIKPIIVNSNAEVEKPLVEDILPVQIQASLPKTIPIKFGQIFYGTQLGQDGLDNEGKVVELINSLNKYKPEGIEFDKKQLVYQKGLIKTEKGCCTSMALEFAKQCFDHREISLKNNETTETFINRIKKFGSSNFSRCSKEMRILQAAFNTIKIKQNIRKNNDVDHSKNKVQAVANFYHFNINFKSKEIDFNKKEFKKEVQNLPEGDFLLRILKTKNNHKLEDYGHTFIYSKMDQCDILYDPNLGAENFPRNEAPAKLFEAFTEYYEDWKVSKARFYRLEKKTINDQVITLRAKL